MPSKLYFLQHLPTLCFISFQRQIISRVPPRDLAWDGIQVQGIKKHIPFERMSLVECDNECAMLHTEGLF